MNNKKHDLLLADDDIDDCIFFKEALEDLLIAATLTTVNNGVDLMQLLTAQPGNLPDILFLDLNMPRKTGIECLSEIKADDKLTHLPVIIFSTSLDMDVVNMLYEKGARYYIRKPAEFSKLKQIIHKAITLVTAPDQKQPAKENFVLRSG